MVLVLNANTPVDSTSAKSAPALRGTSGIQPTGADPAGTASVVGAPKLHGLAGDAGRTSTTLPPVRMTSDGQPGPRSRASTARPSGTPGGAVIGVARKLRLTWRSTDSTQSRGEPAGSSVTATTRCPGATS